MKNVILAAIISTSILSCKKEATMTYHYADKQATINCENIDSKLFSEAYYAFENAIVTQAKNTNKRPNFNITTDYALRNFLTRSRGNIKITDYVTKESFEVFNSLKTLDIWDGNQLKTNSNLLDCIGNGISNPTIKASFNSLRSVQSLSPKLMISTIVDNRTIRDQYKDKVLMTYAALDMYYAKFYNTDFSAVTFLTEQDKATEPISKSNSTVAPQVGKALNLDVKNKKQKVTRGHEGHNH